MRGRDRRGWRKGYSLTSVKLSIYTGITCYPEGHISESRELPQNESDTLFFLSLSLARASTIIANASRFRLPEQALGVEIIRYFFAQPRHATRLSQPTHLTLTGGAYV